MTEENVCRFIDVDSFFDGKVTDFDDRYKEAIYQIERNGIRIRTVPLDQSLLDLAEVLRTDGGSRKFVDDYYRILSPYWFGFNKEKIDSGNLSFSSEIIANCIVVKIGGEDDKWLKSSDIESFLKLYLFYSEGTKGNISRRMIYADFLEKEKDFIDSCLSGETEIAYNHNKEVSDAYFVVRDFLGPIAGCEETKFFTVGNLIKLSSSADLISYFLKRLTYKEIVLKWFRECFLKKETSYSKVSKRYFDLVKRSVISRGYSTEEGFEIGVQLMANHKAAQKDEKNILTLILQQITELDVDFSPEGLVDFLTLFGKKDFRVCSTYARSMLISLLFFAYGESAVRFFADFASSGLSYGRSFSDWVELAKAGLFDTPELGVINSMRLAGAEL